MYFQYDLGWPFVKGSPYVDLFNHQLRKLLSNSLMKKSFNDQVWYFSDFHAIMLHYNQKVWPTHYCNDCTQLKDSMMEEPTCCLSEGRVCMSMCNPITVTIIQAIAIMPITYLQGLKARQHRIFQYNNPRIAGKIYWIFLYLCKAIFPTQNCLRLHNSGLALACRYMWQKIWCLA